jgi:flagellar biosynthesis protein FlhB
MADQSQKTEEPTQRRQQKAREEGQFASARQFIGGMQFLAFVAMASSRGADWLDAVAATWRMLFRRAFAPEFSAPDLAQMAIALSWRCLAPLVAAGAVLVLLTLALQLAVTRMGFSVTKLAPDFKRLNPMNRLKQLPGQNLPALVQATILLPLFGYAVYAIARDHIDAFLALPLSSIRSGAALVGQSMLSLMWKAATLFMIFGLVELFREQHKHSNTLKMSKQEIKDEMKDSEGNPQMKAKIRALRRDQARRRMMQAVPTATAVVVNPTHFAVALKYDPATMAAPLVVAKGKDFLALRIRALAVANQVPLIENPPLARALYKSVDVGREIPPHLYRAVAEILAFIFKIMNRK